MLEKNQATTRRGRRGRAALGDGITIAQLRATVRGRVIAPGDAAYDAARTVFVGGIDRRPAVILRAADATDVAFVVSLARETGLELAIRSGGHSAAGHGVSEGGIVLDLSEMRALQIDAKHRTAWAETGLTAGQYTAATDADGLATGFGDTGSVGIGGITLGGGIGYLVRKHGLTIDDLLAADIVTADGQLHRVDAQANPDLFWAIRGGGGNFGVVTRVEFRLHEVDQVVGGMLLLPATPDVIRSFVAAAEAAPEELSTVANVMTAPPMPFVPAEYHGRIIVLAMLVHAGSLEAGQRAVAPFRSLATPIADMVRPMRYPEIYPPEEAGYHPVVAGRSLFVDSVDDATAEAIIHHLQSSTSSMAAAQLRVLGGAMARVPVEATAFAHRRRRILVNLASMYQRPDEALAHQAWIDRFATTLHHADSAVYVNFLGQEGEARVHDAYPGSTWDRLAAIKASYDPTNLFRLNQNVPPANSRATLEVL
jgi:FAD/FMN-containing dehydrogenase